MELRKTERQVENLLSLYANTRRVVSSAITRATFPLHFASLSMTHLPAVEDVMENVSSANFADESSPTVEHEQSVVAQVKTGNIVCSKDDIADAEQTPVKDILASMESIAAGIIALNPSIKRFQGRLTEKDPVTGNARYGPQSKARVELMLDSYAALSLAIEKAREGGTFDILQRAVAAEEEVELKIRSEKEILRKANEDSTRKKEQLLMQQKAEEERKILDKRKEEVAELARQAEASRKARVEEERRRMEDERLAVELQREADRAFMDSVEKGEAGIRKQLDSLRKSCAEDAASYSVAIGALHTIFSQITGNPEEVCFRKIRRDHPKFHEDVGRHRGGRELLIAAGFKLETVDEVPCFFSNEPNLENDMDGWSAWFDGLKRTLELIEEYMMK